MHGILDQMCVPDGAQDTYSFTLGGSLPCTSYVFSDFVNMSDFTVTSDNCIPISGQFFTRTPRKHSYFLNIINPVAFCMLLFGLYVVVV